MRPSAADHRRRSGHGGRATIAWGKTPHEGTGGRGNVLLVRNHEINNPVPAFGDAAQAYDTMAGGGTTTTEVTRFG
jgi:hypothetical protein